ncbi:MAG: hypothetical protein IJ853_02685 [Rickettsiales bacterium]|nr:hypothetical protein [Rickettsiales bacterium]
MNKILNLRIYIPDKLFLEEVVVKVSVLGKEGFYTILPNHLDYVSSFEDGIIFFKKQTEENVFIGVNQGVLVKCGREIQVSTFNAVYGGNTIEELKNVLKSSIKRENELISIEKKIKTSLKNIEFELFRKIKTLESYD